LNGLQVFSRISIVRRAANWHQGKLPVWCFAQAPESLMIAAPPQFASRPQFARPEPSSRTTGGETRGMQKRALIRSRDSEREWSHGKI
jgi:hypothetical protein